MSKEEAQCIFCGEHIPADSEECPHCNKKPFSGMYFDPETYNVVEQLEKDGELEKAWRILHEEWMQHGDVDYYDDEMYFELLEKMHELYERNLSLIRQRVDLVKDVWRKIAYHSYDISETEVEIGLNIARNAGRQDLVEDLKNFLKQVGKF